MDIKQLIIDEELYINKIHDLVAQSLKEEELLSAKLMSLEVDSDVTFGQRLADGIATFGGSWTFIISFFVLLALWILGNVFLLTRPTFDPYPFILLNLILSCIASLQAPVIMMSQNRQETKDRRRARSDYMVNLKAEMEVRGLHSKIDILIADQMKNLFQIQKAQLELLERIEQKLNLQI